MQRALKLILTIHLLSIGEIVLILVDGSMIRGGQLLSIMMYNRLRRWRSRRHLN